MIDFSSIIIQVLLIEVWENFSRDCWINRLSMALSRCNHKLVI